MVGSKMSLMGTFLKFYIAAAEFIKCRIKLQTSLMTIMTEQF